MNNKMTVENDNIDILMNKINTADAIVIGGGSGLSSAAGYNHYHSKEIIEKKFKEFEKNMDLAVYLMVTTIYIQQMKKNGASLANI